MIFPFLSFLCQPSAEDTALKDGNDNKENICKHNEDEEGINMRVYFLPLNSALLMCRLMRARKKRCEMVIEQMMNMDVSTAQMPDQLFLNRK